MNKLLINYIRRYLNESPVPYAGRYISANIQHKLSPNIKKDMTDLIPEEVMKILMKNIDERTCISFVNSYNKSIPSFNINPRAAYHTPHGNYAYPLTLTNLKDLIDFGKVDGQSFAVDRPYFLLFKINSPNTIFIDSDGTTNYNSVRSARRGSAKSKVISVNDDINTIIRNFIYFVRTLSITNPKDQEWSSLDSDIYYKQQPHAYSKLEDKFEELLNKDITVEIFIKRFGTGLRAFLTKNTSLTFKNKVPNDIEKHFFDETFDLLKDYLVELADSEINKFFKGEEETDDFHKVYFICWLLSQVGVVTNIRKNNGPILTLLLRSIGLDGIIDQGSSTLHSHEPTQSVSLSFGNVKAANIDFLGTFDNIFKSDASRSGLNEIAAEIYAEEGFKYSKDFFSNEEESRTADPKDSWAYKETKSILDEYNLNDIILNTNFESVDLHMIFDIEIHLDANRSAIMNMLDKIHDIRERYRKSTSGEGEIFFDIKLKKHAMGYKDITVPLYHLLNSQQFIRHFSWTKNCINKLLEHDASYSYLNNLRFEYFNAARISIGENMLSTFKSYSDSLFIFDNCSAEFVFKDLNILNDFLNDPSFVYGDTARINFTIPKIDDIAEKMRIKKKIKSLSSNANIKIKG